MQQFFVDTDFTQRVHISRGSAEIGLGLPFGLRAGG